jgi:hypothetical protein
VGATSGVGGNGEVVREMEVDAVGWGFGEFLKSQENWEVIEVISSTFQWKFVMRTNKTSSDFYKIPPKIATNPSFFTQNSISPSIPHQFPPQCQCNLSQLPP